MGISFLFLYEKCCRMIFHLFYLFFYFEGIRENQFGVHWIYASNMKDPHPLFSTKTAHLLFFHSKARPTFEHSSLFPLPKSGWNLASLLARLDQGSLSFYGPGRISVVLSCSWSSILR